MYTYWFDIKNNNIILIMENACLNIKMFVVVYVGCFLMWNSFHSVQSKDLDLDDENHHQYHKVSLSLLYRTSGITFLEITLNVGVDQFHGAVEIALHNGVVTFFVRTVI